LVVNQDEMDKFKGIGTGTSPWTVACWDYTPGLNRAVAKRGGPCILRKYTQGDYRC
jgi:hypothetical protein